MRIEVEVKPKDKTFKGWDVNIMSWTKNRQRVNVHKLTWGEETKGVFVGSTVDLPSGAYIVRAELFGPGVEVNVTVRHAVVTQPQGKPWPMNVKVDGGQQTMNSDTWYFTV